MLTILFRQNILYLEIFLNTFERSDAMAFADTFKALSDPARREILQLLKNGRMSAGEIGSHFHMTGATVSYHLKILKKADLIWDLDRIAFVESASDKDSYPFFHWKYSRWLEQQGNYRFRTSAFYVCNDVVLLSFHPC